MNRICKLSAIALLASSTSLMAQSSSFEGVSLGISASVIGAEVSGSLTTAGGNASSGSLGKAAEIAAIDLSYGFAVAPNAIIQVGASYTPGKAKAGTGTYTDNQRSATSNSSSNTDMDGSVNIEVKDPFTIYIAPMYVVSKDAAVYFKVGYSAADINTSATGGAALTKKPDDLEGFTYSLGSKTMLTPNLYLGVEASITDYDTVSATTAAVGTNAAVGSTGSRTINADIKTVQGIVTLGYRF
jgi:hypothetical protein